MARLGGRTAALWPDDLGQLTLLMLDDEAFHDGAQSGDITDRYGAATIRDGSLIAGTAFLPSLGISAMQLLSIVDPSESRRCSEALSVREARRTRTPPGDGILRLLVFVDLDTSPTEEEEIVARFGLTIQQALVIAETASIAQRQP